MVVIEVNPRLTTSYVGLREMTRDNLAHAMVRTAQGEQAELLFEEHAVDFCADGTVTRKAGD